MINSHLDAAHVLAELRSFIEAATPNGPMPAIKPGHRVKFEWPPHPVSYSYHVLASDWSGATTIRMHGETFGVQIARTPLGIFGKIDELWLEARGQSEEDMLRKLRDAAAPLFTRQLGISACLGCEGRFKGHIRDLSPSDLVKMLYCPDRDVASEARTEIETHASLHLFTPALTEILRDERHPQRRSAQWCVLDLFEDLPAFVSNPQEEKEALEAIKSLIWSAPDDYARTIYKAGVVLGGHLPHMAGGRFLISCLDAPSKFGRRSAIHGLFHTVEWVPDLRDEVIASLHKQADLEVEPLLREFAKAMALDIEHGSYEHVPEPVFEGE